MKDKVRIVDGYYSFVARNGNIPATSNLLLSFILHVLNFTLNLLSISHLTKSLNCSVTFSLLLFISGHGDKDAYWYKA